MNSSTGKLKVAEIGLGPIGCAVARLAAAHPACDLVGAADVAPEIAGRDLGDVLGIDPLGVEIAPSIDALLDRARPDLVLHTTGSFIPDVDAELRQILGCGISIVSTCEELSYPFYRHPELSRDLDTLAAKHGAVLLGTGVNPGFAMDKLIATTLAACARVDRVWSLRIVNAATRREPLQRKVGAGITPEEFDRRKATGKFGHIGMTESAHMVADVIGVPHERKVTNDLRPKIAERKIKTDYLTVEPGQVTGVHQIVTVESAGKERARLELQMYVGAEDPRDTFRTEGDPPLELSLPGGVPGDSATASITLHTALCTPGLAPGLRTMLDVPLRHVPGL
jgi:4-hydroxy-tetrahydrodipicolinate reductase